MKLQTFIIIFLILIIAGVIFYFKACTEQERISETQIIHDTTTITRYETQYKTNTEIKWLEKIVKVQSEPKVIYQQKIDSVFIEKTKSYDLILGIEKKGTNLRVFAMNQNSMLLKEQLFENVYDNFTAYSTTDKVIVKSNLFYFNGIKIGYEHKRPIRDLKTYSHSIDVMTGVSFIDKLSLDAGAEYDSKDINLKAKLTWRLF